jgi:hypothetical protein
MGYLIGFQFCRQIHSIIIGYETVETCIFVILGVEVNTKLINDSAFTHLRIIHVMQKLQRRNYLGDNAVT